MTAVEPVLCEVSDEPLSVDAHQAAVAGDMSGAVVVFSGIVRNHDHGRAVTALEYVGHPSATDVLRACRDEIAADPRVHEVAVSHRIGHLQVGDAALVAAVSAAHRAEAFEACERLVNLVKQRLPIWKRQVFPDGTDEWVNCP
jgi:molybdopterin synthase catalytic subunit